MGKNTAKSEAGTPAPLKSVEFLVLAVLRDESMHGYGLVQQIADRTDGRIALRPGDLYRVLYRMSERDLVVRADQRRTTESGDERRTYYRITPKGRKTLAAEAEFLARIAAEAMDETSRSLAEAT
jgi:DNA-binding PadR family transcriptional regulator